MVNQPILNSIPKTQNITPAGAAADCGSVFQWKLWLYTNYDCNLRCSYCVAKSSPNAPRRALGLANVRRLVDEALELGFSEIFFTGGEPFILPDIYEMLAYSSQRVKTSVLTNAMILRGKRLDQLQNIANDSLTVQVSLDGGRPEHHDAYRGKGSWEQAVVGIKLLQDRGLHVRLSTTETPVNRDHLDEVCELHRSLGISDQDHFVRPLARRGNSKEGLDLAMNNIVPEVSVNVDGVFWHPLSADPDMQVSRKIFPLAESVDTIRQQLAILESGGNPLIAFT
jgi:sulfatase maturation enzyme AslB (radical SAM superfamily)